MLLGIFLIIILVLSGVLICAMLWQRDVFIKLLFLNVATSVSSLFICCLASYKGNSSYIDIALIYFLLSVVANAGYLKYFLHKNHNERTER